jgi:CheY-like chemotaxis protein
MDSELSHRKSGSFHALGERLLREAFPAMEREAVENYLRRADARVQHAAATLPVRSPLPSRPVVTDPSEQFVPTVLVVDDEEDLRDIMRRMLERRGFRTLTASDANEALRLCRAQPGAIDFVLTDLGLPGIGGREFARAAAASQPHSHVVYVSGLPREIAIRDNLITADDILLKKPFSTEALIAVLQTVSESSTNRTT